MTNESSLRRPAIPFLASGAALVLLGCGLAACSSGTSADSQADTTLHTLSSALTAGQSHTEALTYTSVGITEGSPNPVTAVLEKAPLKSRFSLSSPSGGPVESVIETGKITYFCSSPAVDGVTTSALVDATCTEEAGNADPLSSAQSAYSPQLALTLFQTAEAQLKANVAGTQVSITKRTFAHHAATCVVFGKNGADGTYCVTASGVLAYAGEKGSNITLVADTAVPPNAFSVPASLPAG
jgi:hypothetical protein